jgi:hypothetical protein
MRKLALALTAWMLSASVASAQIITGSVPNTFVNGTIIDATQVNADYTYIISQVNANGAKNGVNNDIIALSALSSPLTPAQSGSNIYYAGTSTGTANAQVVATATPTNFTLSTGKTIRFIAGFTNTGATTLAVNGLLATAVVRQTPLGIQALTGGEIAAGALTEAYYDGVQFQLLTNVTENGGFGILTTLAGSATPDLGTVPSHNVNLSGGPFTITSFGASATAAYPMYLVRFNAANILTQSAGLNLIGGVSRLTASGDQGLYQYNGGNWFELAYFPAVVKLAPTGATQLTVKNNAVTPNTLVDITAAEVVMDSATGGNAYTDSYGTCTINFGVVGAGGIDAGAIAANTWYHFYAISTGIATSCLASTSATAPTLPAGYPYKVRVGANRTSSAAATLWPVAQQGAKAQFSALPAVPADILINTSGGGLGWGTCSATTQTLIASPTVWGTFAPATAKAVNIAIVAQSAGQSCVAPYPIVTGATAQGVTMCASGINASTTATPAEINYVGTNTFGYCALSSLSSTLDLTGWVDRVNAN